MATPQLALVFDDGYAEEYHEYRSVVQDREVPFSLAITPARLGDEGHLTVEQLRELVETGCDVLAHGRRHRYLQAHRLADAATADGSVA